MKRVRIGNDICIRWSIYTKEGLPYDLCGKNLRLFLNSAMGGRVPVYDFTTDSNVVVWTFKGKSQKRTGNYTLTLVENFESDDMHTVDSCIAFRLDSTTPNTSGIGCSNVEISTVELHSELAVSYPNGDDMKVIEWHDKTHLDTFISPGNYLFAGTRIKTEDDGLPIYNKGELNAQLTVLVGGNCVMQKLTLLNVGGGGDGNVYLRTQQNGKWGHWGKLQTNVEVGLIGVGQAKTFDDFTDNGMYSGVNAYATGQTGSNGYPIVGAETFVLVVINAYLYGGGISQLKYSLKLDGTLGITTRKMINGAWSGWDAV